MNVSSIQKIMFSGVTAFALLSVLLFGIAYAGDQLSSPKAGTDISGKVLGIAFNTVQVSNLERSINYYRMLGFTPLGDTDPAWIGGRHCSTRGWQSCSGGPRSGRRRIRRAF